MGDKTYCANGSCPFKDCDRHLCKAPKKKGMMVSIAALDGVCRRYIGYLVDKISEEGA